MNPRFRAKSLAIIATISCFSGIGRAQTFESLFSFPASSASGKTPIAGLTIGPDGDFYGTCRAGGAENLGTAFKITASGTFTLLGSFSSATTGEGPLARMVNMGDGYLYGVTEFLRGVASKGGAVFKLDPAGGAGAAGGLSQVFQFPTITGPASNPAAPQSLISLEPGVLLVLGASPSGLWRVPVSSPASSEVLYRFANPPDGVFAQSLSFGSDGFLYGVTGGIGSGVSDSAASVNSGTVFRFSSDFTSITNVHTCFFPNGSQPCGAATPAADGNFYGIMQSGGNGPSTGSNIEAGCIYRLTPAGEYTKLHIFAVNGDTLRPSTEDASLDLVQASDGFLYGVTSSGGSAGVGGVFRIKLDGSGYKIVHQFIDSTGKDPRSGLVQGDDGNLYGTTSRGGSGAFGTIYRIKLPAPPLNRNPLAADDVAFSVGLPVEVNVLANDVDPEGGALTVTIIGEPNLGSVVVNPSGTVTYTPGVGYTGLDSFTYRVSDALGKSDTAEVTITSDTLQPELQPGSYNGLVFAPTWTRVAVTPAPMPEGQVIATVSAAGKVTGSISFKGKKVRFSGTVKAGSSIIRVKLSGPGKGAIVLSFDRFSPGILNASVVDSAMWRGTLNAVIVDTAKPAPAPVLYTMTLSNGSSFGGPAPLGSGYATGKHTPKTGSVKFVGKLPDGTKLTWGSSVVRYVTLVRGDTPSQFVPVYTNPTKGGVCGGYFFLEGNSPEFFWSRPASTKPGAPYPSGFVVNLTPTVSVFTPTTTLSAMAVFSQSSTISAVNAGVGGSFAVNGSKIDAIVPPLKSVSLNKKTGAFKGSLLIENKPVKFNGVILQGRNTGSGQLIRNGETDSVVLTP